jgi:hypothetical protein
MKFERLRLISAISYPVADVCSVSAGKPLIYIEDSLGIVILLSRPTAGIYNSICCLLCALISHTLASYNQASSRFSLLWQGAALR